MKKSKNSIEDRLSELPDSLIYEIFWWLPMGEVVQTTILSKRWNNLWKTTPYLNFDGQAPEFVNRALLLRRGFRFLKFKFGCGFFRYNKSVVSDIDVWVRLAKESGVEELYLDDVYVSEEDVSYSVPHCLYSCSSLKVLSLIGCKLQNHGNVQWNALRSLTIEVDLYDELSINQVVCGCPRLEVFVLILWPKSRENLSIRSTSLKKLSIDRKIYDQNPPAVLELRIWFPNLEVLEIVGAPYGKCLFMDVSSLTHLTLDFSFQMCKDDISGEELWKIFPTIQHVDIDKAQGLGVGDMKEKYLLSPLLNVRFLTINCCGAHYEQIMDLLHLFPKLETLALRSDQYQNPANHVDSLLHCERNLPESFLLLLRTLEITWYKVDHFIFPFIEILLKHASKLQKMAIRVQRIKPQWIAWFLEKLQRMPRSSPTAELIFAKDSL